MVGIVLIATKVDQYDVLEKDIDMVESRLEATTTYTLVRCSTPALAPENKGTFPPSGR